MPSTVAATAPQPVLRHRRPSPSKPSAAAKNADQRSDGRSPSSPSSSATSLFFLYASIAGACGALSGSMGKLAVAAEGVPALSQRLLDGLHLDLAPDRRDALVYVLPLLLRVLCFVSNALLTGQMWRYYIKALALGPTPVCSILNTGTNFAVSAFVGITLFGEEVNLMWASGAVLVLVGLALVVMDPQAAAHQR
ncbi:hypothetical protein STCU_02200 [Strigomonas culicis]|uniref:Uncharacterized protein n=1 Tax=Strigomonas culicis TaxID=28005 RepID=S9UXJ2_9TRYP|nr:hypothetical protein STCU_02200 [Strigomonas culicis]|eukprot:EPY33474.1 hypothetical protein STCU_02200 [Strigomonas culicis]